MSAPRVTRQRQVILEELRKLDTHPTADELYSLVRDIIPNISLGTVYRNLESFSRSGIIQKLEFAGGRKQFDGNPEPHFHFRCGRCGAVIDVFTDKKQVIDDVVSGLETRGKVDGYSLELTGTCERCLTASGD